MSNLEMILSQLKRCADHPMASATAMPKQLYTSPEIAALEIERLFMRQWICAGRSDEIPHSGDYMSFDLCDQPLIIQRHADGVIHAMSNVCRHRMNTRTIYLGPITGFLYLNMQYHLEHHLYPNVPYYHLPALHQVIKDKCPPAYHGLWPVFAEMLPVLWRQRSEPGYHIQRPLPAENPS